MSLMQKDTNMHKNKYKSYCFCLIFDSFLFQRCQEQSCISTDSLFLRNVNIIRWLQLFILK